MTIIESVDPELAAQRFWAHLGEIWSQPRTTQRGWGLIRLCPLKAVVALPSALKNGRRDWYFVRADARCYDQWPVDVAFVVPDRWCEAPAGSRWYPKFEGKHPIQFGLHNAYNFGDGSPTRQLICFSHTLGYYESNHGPQESERWTPGRHTVSATLSRIAMMLEGPTYAGPSGT